jgi:hypothetical protein
MDVKVVSNLSELIGQPWDSVSKFIFVSARVVASSPTERLKLSGAYLIFNTMILNEGLRREVVSHETIERLKTYATHPSTFEEMKQSYDFLQEILEGVFPVFLDAWDEVMLIMRKFFTL